MRKLFFLVALLSASIMSFAANEVNFALATEGSSATASSGDASLAIDGNNGSRWESEKTDNEWFLLDLGQSRTFNYIKILWEGAFAKQFQLLASADGETFTDFYTESNLEAAGWQSLYFETAVTARYIKYQGIERATQWGQSFFEFQVFYLAEAPKTYTQITGLTIVASSGGENDVNRVLDGNAGTEWQGRPAGITGGDETARTFDAWFVADLGGLYSIDKVDVHFEGACAQDYHIDFSTDNTTWATAYNYVGTAGTNGRTDEITELDNNAKVRYVRFWSTKAATEWGMKIFEFRVYGEEYVASGDTEKPVMTSASLVSKTHNSAVIAVAATDNDEVVKYRVADAAQSFDAKFAPAEGKITVTGLTPSTAYTFSVYAVDAAGNESESALSVSVTTDAYASAPAAAAPAPTWPAAQVKAIYSPTYEADCNFQDWGSGTAYTQEEYGKKYSVPASGYFGTDGFSINAMTMEVLHYDIWVADNATLRIVPICRNAADDGNEPEYGVTVNLTGQQWNSIDLALNAGEFAKVTNWSNVYQVKIDNAANLTFWVGNAYFYRETALEDNEAPTNVQGRVASAGYFSVTLALSADDNMGVVNFSVKNGEVEVAKGAGAAGATVNVVVADLLPNTEYNFTVIAGDEKGNAAEAITVAAKTAVAPAAAPVPDFTNKETVTVFCDALENNPGIGIGGWGQSTVVTNGQLAEGDNVQYFTNMNYLGWELTPAVDATGMEYLHVDLYTTTLSSVKITPISPGHEGAYAVELTSGEWNSVEIPLSAYETNGIEWNNIFQMKFFDAAPAGGDLFVDNVYFYKATGSSGEGVENVQGDKVQCTKVMENGVLYLKYEGRMYNVQGVRVK